VPTVYRAMRKAEDGFPIVAPHALGLSVREPLSPNADVDVDESGNVAMNGRGMSVAKHWRDLPKHRVPVRLDDGEQGAVGPNSNFCWRFGEGEFRASELTARLALAMKKGSTTTGNIVPTAPVPLRQFQSDLAATREGWVVDEV
jgi:hypothetical protein